MRTRESPGKLNARSRHSRHGMVSMGVVREGVNRRGDLEHALRMTCEVVKSVN
jgi:hypothetical protein